MVKETRIVREAKRGKPGRLRQFRSGLRRGTRNPEAAEAFASTLALEPMVLRTSLELQSIRSAKERVLNYLALNTRAYGRTITRRGTVKGLPPNPGSHEALRRADRMHEGLNRPEESD